MEDIIFEGYADIEGTVREFRIVEHKWFTEMVIDLEGAPNYPLIMSVGAFQVSGQMIAVNWIAQDGTRGTSVFHSYRPKLAV